MSKFFKDFFGILRMMIQRANKYFIFVLIGFFLLLSGIETISTILIVWGVVGDILSNLTINKHEVNNFKTTNNIKKGAYYLDSKKLLDK